MVSGGSGIWTLICLTQKLQQRSELFYENQIKVGVKIGRNGWKITSEKWGEYTCKKTKFYVYQGLTSSLKYNLV